MCGITGFVEPAGKRSASELHAIARSMADAIAHRGPDDHDTWVDPRGSVAFGHRRLSIVDLSPTGHQPMSSHSGRWTTCFNGEVYNFQDLRRSLEQEGVRFRGTSDTEVLLEAIERWGLEGALGRAIGMWAFALWDEQLRVLHLVRDRMGEKPLYHGFQGGAFLFGSELKALRRHPSWAAGIDRGALALYMRLAYVPAPWTIQEGIRMLPPGTVLSLTQDQLAHPGMGARVEPVAYWTVMGAALRGLANPLLCSEDEAADQLDALLRDAVSKQVVADVPLGAFLSGGIDSSTVVALMQAQSARPVKTFAIGFREVEYDEATHARGVASHLGTDHEDLQVTPDEAREVIPRLADMYDEPFADSSQVPTHLVAALARKHVTVSLSGDGGDELFAGYDRYLWTRTAWGAAAALPLAARRLIASAMTALPESAWTSALHAAGPLAPAAARKPNAGAKVHRLARLITERDARTFYRELVTQWRDPEGLVLGSREPPTAFTAEGERPPWRDLIEQVQYLDQVAYLPHDILTKVDRAAMAVSLESRVPLLDHRVVEFSWRLPPAMKVRRGKGKWLLRRVLARYVPERLTDRPKAGFGVPIDHWLRGPLRAWAEDLLDEGRLRREGWLDPVPVRAAWLEHQRGQREHHYRLWAVLMFQAWLERWSGRS